MGNPYMRKRSIQSVSLRPRESERNMNSLPVPITTLDGDRHESTSLATTLRHHFPHVLLIECMLERLCATYETDSVKQKELYDALRMHFIRFRLLPPTAGFPEMNGVRLRISSDLNKLFCLAKHQITTTNRSSAAVGSLVVANNPSPLVGSVWSPIDGSDHLFTSRYELDFKEMEFIAAGGFGVVYKARNILDNNDYAIKKIIIGPRSANKIIREVHLLSQLHHPNIVAYKSAWLEICPPQTLHDIFEHMDGLSISSQEEASLVNLGSYSYSRECEVKSTHRQTSSSSSNSNSSDSVVFESQTPTNSPSSRSRQFTYRQVETSTRSIVMSSQCQINRLVRSPVMLLYIQMQLCPQTLRHWLKNRNLRQNKLENVSLELSIFNQIVQGINYIHKRNIIHRDIKPENIFVNPEANQVLIGDFGLAVLDFRNESNSNVLSTTMPVIVRDRASTRGVGTQAYAAPEQLASEPIDAKSDIYSLGIVFLELLHPFKTDMERYKTIEKLRSHSELPEELGKKWPQMASLIFKMTSCDRALRPSAAEIIGHLSSDATSTGRATIIIPSSQLSNDELLLIIEDLRRQVAEKDLIIESLTKNKL